MKKFLIAIIIILCILLIGQLAYFNYKNNNYTNTIEANTTNIN